MRTYICRTCGFSEGEQKLCPNCDESLVELTLELEVEFQNNLVLHNAVSMMNGKKWY